MRCYHKHNYDDEDNENVSHFRANDVISRANTASGDPCTISARLRTPRGSEECWGGGMSPTCSDFQRRKRVIHRDRVLGLWLREIRFPR